MKFIGIKDKKTVFIVFSFLILFLASIIIVNEFIKNKLEKTITLKLSEYQHKMEKQTDKRFYYDFSESQIKCNGFFKYQCNINNVFLFANYGHINGKIFNWNLKLNNLTLKTIQDFIKNKKLDNVGFQIINFKPTYDYSALFMNNIAKYAFPINIQNYITFHKVLTKTIRNIDKNLSKKEHNFYYLNLTNSFFKIPAFDLNYAAKILLERTPKGFELFLNNKNEFIGEPKSINDYSTNIHVTSQYKIIIKNTFYEITNYHIPEMLYAWYKNVGKNSSYLYLNNKFFYINKKEPLTFKEFNQAIIDLLNKAIEDAKKVKEKGIDVYIKYLIGIKNLYIHKIKALKVEIYNKYDIPLQALTVQKQLFPGIYHTVKFLTKYYDFKIIYIK